MQRYVDEAFSFQERIYAANHILKCESCSGRIEQLKKRKRAIIHALDNTAGSKLSHIPEFIPDTTRTRILYPWILRWVVPVAAASMVLAIIIPSLWSKHEEKDQIIVVRDYTTDVDANRPITEQEVVLKMVDENGNITEWEITQE